MVFITIKRCYGQDESRKMSPVLIYQQGKKENEKEVAMKQSKSL